MREREIVSRNKGVRTGKWAATIAAMILAAILAVPASAQQPPKPPNPNMNRQLVHGALAGNLVRAPLQRTMLQPNLLRLQSRPAIAFKPFEMMDPKTNKPIAPTAIIHLPNGKNPTAQQYYSELNNYEKWLSEHGYSLHTTPQNAKTKLLEIPLDHALIQRQLMTLPKPTGLQRRQDLLFRSSALQSLTTPQPLQLNSAHLAAARIAAPPDAAHLNTLNQKLSAAGVKGVVRDGMVINPEVFSSLVKLNTEAAGAANAKMAASPGAVSATKPIDRRVIKPGVINLPAMTVQCQNVNKSQNWNWNTGDPNTFYAYLDGSIGISGAACKPPDMSHFDNNASHFQVTAEGKAGGSVFGVGGELLRITGHMGGDANGHTVSAGMGVYALGVDIFSINKTQAGHLSVGDKVSKDIDLSTSFPVQIGPFDIDVTVGAKGSVGFQYSFDLYPSSVALSGGPFVHSSVYAQAGLNVLIAEAGVGVQMTLINADLSIHGAAGIGWLLKFYVNEEVYADANLDMLDGSVYVYAKVHYPCFDPWPDICTSEWDTNLWSWDGIKFNSVLFDVKNVTPLDW